MAEYRDAKGMKMRTIVVKKADLLAKLKTNRELHLKEFEESKTEYVEAALILVDKKKQELLKALKELRSKLEAGPTQLALDADVYFNLKVPESFVDQYDQAIAMTEWETREEVELDSVEFQRYVRNIWEWTESFASNKRMYYAVSSTGLSK